MPEGENSSVPGCLVWFLGIVVAVSALGILTEAFDRTPKKSKVDQWFDDYPIYDCEQKVKSNLRDPESYEKIQMLMPTNVSSDEKILRWQFRARNGFGGYNVSTAECIVKKENGGSIEVSID
jgi:hypothetical protein